MNPWLIPTIAVTFAFFGLGIWISPRTHTRLQNFSLFALGFVAAVPAFLFVIYYTGILGEAAWFYSFRAIPGTELTAGGLGLLAGWLQVKRGQNKHISRLMSAGFMPFLMLLGIAIPYLKPILLRPNWNAFNDNWSEGVCLQSSESSCGPASAATLLKFYGKTFSEKQIAQESFTSRRGTENWYLVRTLRRHGLHADYLVNPPGTLNFKIPSIIGVRLGDETGSGHFITVLGKEGNAFVVGDPLSGRNELSEKSFREHYYFTGFSILVTTN